MSARQERTFVPLSMEGLQQRYFIPCRNNCCLAVARNFLVTRARANLCINLHVNNEFPRLFSNRDSTVSVAMSLNRDENSCRALIRSLIPIWTSFSYIIKDYDMSIIETNIITAQDRYQVEIVRFDSVFVYKWKCLFSRVSLNHSFSYIN